MAHLKPADIARDTLKLLASRKLAPTPQNYQAVYEEVAGLLPQVAFPQTPLRRIASMLPTQTQVQKRMAAHFSQAVEAQDWADLQSTIVNYAQLDLGIAPQHALPHLPTASAPLPHTVPESLADMLARVIETTMAALGEEDHRMRDLSDQLVRFLRTAPPSQQTLEQMLHNYSYRLSFTSEDQAQRRRSMQAVLRIVIAHIASVASHDPSLQRQSQALSDAMEQPWTLEQLDNIQTRMKSLLFRHLEIESSRTEARAQLKQLLAEHAGQMSSLGKLSERHAQDLQQCAQHIQQAQDLGDLASALEAVVQSGNALATENRMVQAQLADLLEQTQAQELQITSLTHSLQEMEESTRHDPETGALNAQGLKEALLCEAIRTHRAPQPASLACLQIDQLEQVAEEGGPCARSAALTHMARQLRNTLRPQDILAHTGNGQFVMLLPGTEATQTSQALARLQAQLQQCPLLLEERLVNLSFSAGVMDMSGIDTPAEALQRVMATCEQAQRMGSARAVLG